VKVESFPSERNRHPELDGFGAALDFQPDGTAAPKSKKTASRVRILQQGRLYKKHPYLINSILSYDDFATAMLARDQPAYPRFPAVFRSWDNSARRRKGGANIIHGSTRQLYGKWLQRLLSDSRAFHNLPEPVLFINVWSKWVEGNHLEPCHKWGHQYLDETRTALDEL
jgi:hypothetical protein